MWRATAGTTVTFAASGDLDVVNGRVDHIALLAPGATTPFARSGRTTGLSHTFPADTEFNVQLSINDFGTVSVTATCLTGPVPTPTFSSSAPSSR
jgi:hypothetical protein